MTRHTPSAPTKGLARYIPNHYPDTLPESYRDLWLDIWDYGAGLYTVRDSLTIEKYIKLKARYDEAQELIDLHGLIEEGSQGQRVPSAAFRVSKELATQLQAIEDRLGLSPRSAAEIGLNKIKGAKAGAELEKLKNKGS